MISKHPISFGVIVSISVASLSIVSGERLKEINGANVPAMAAELSMQQASDELRLVVGVHPEPYRAVLKQLRERLRATRAWAVARSALRQRGS